MYAPGFASMALPVGDEFSVRIVDEETLPSKTKKPKHPAKPKAGDKLNKEGGGGDAPTHGLPGHRLLTKDGRSIGDQSTDSWPENFTESDGGYAHDLGAGQIMCYINYDNVYHLKYWMQQKGDVAKDAVTEKYILGMRILMLGYEHSIKTLQDRVGDGIREYLDDFRKMAAKAAASTVLALAENLPKIVSSGPQEAE